MLTLKRWCRFRLKQFRQKCFLIFCSSLLPGFVIMLVSDEYKSLQTWPSEVLEQKLYQGAAIHVSDEEILKSLGKHVLTFSLL